jgi:hypothetical protein
MNVERKASSGLSLPRDARGLSTLEYAVLFVFIVIGGLILWNRLADRMEKNVGTATDDFSSVLSGWQASGAAPASSGSNLGAPQSSATPGVRSPASGNALSLASPGARTPASGSAMSPPPQAAPPGAQSAASGSTTSPQPPAATEGHPPQQAREPGFLESAREFVRESANSQLALGIAAGTAGAIVWPLGFVPSPEGAGKNFEAGRAIGETATGIAEIYAGGVAILGGTAGGGLSLAGSVPSGGTSLAGLIPSAAAIDAGIVLVGVGVSNVGLGIWRGWNAMQMADDTGAGGASSGGSNGASASGGDPPSGGGNKPKPGAQAGAADDLASLSRDPDAHTLRRHGGSVTDDQLQHRARTGVAPDGSTLSGGQIPPISSAFNTDADAVRSLAAARAQVQRQLANMPAGTTVVTIKPVDTGRAIGRGYRRVGSSNPNTIKEGPLQKLDDLTHVQGTFRYNPSTGTWDPITMFPAPAP